MIGLVSYSAGNLQSVSSALDRLAIPHRSLTESSQFDQVKGIIFPGVGSATIAMQDLRSRRLDEALISYGGPFLGVCLGMQLLFEHTQEGDTRALGILKGSVRRLPQKARVPNIGWSRLSSRAWVYFAHSYVCVPEDDRITTATASCGVKFCAALHDGNVFGVQFHPEKSGAAGDDLLRGFARLCK